MVNMERIKREFGIPICRRCINEEYHAALTPKDCVYGNPFPHKCPRCGETRNIVTDLNLSGKWKLLFR